LSPRASIPTDASRGAACILCGAPGLEPLDQIRRQDLETLYVGLAGEELRPEFGGEAPAVLDFVRCRECDLRFFTPALVGSERLYAALQRFPWYYLEEKAEFTFAARFIGDGASVLEVGAGNGAFSRHVRAGRYVGLELNPVAAAEARRRGADVRVESLRDYARREPASCDVVVAFQVLEHLPSPGEFLADAVTALKPGGRLILSVPSEDSYLRLGQNYELNLPPHHQTRWTHETMRAVARLIGGRLLALDHEPLADLHVPDYAFVRCDAALSLGRRTLIDLSRATKLRRLAALALSWIVAPWVRRAKRPPGHSMTAVYERAP
jgi:SAM-dependent methyltransferase